MTEVEVQVPSLLRDCTEGRVRFSVQGATLADALAAMLQAYPLLRVHLFDETGSLRKHVLIFHNDESIKRMSHWDVPLRPGDRLQIIQAVSGG